METTLIALAGEEVTKEVIDSFNPLIKSGDPALAAELSTPGGIISRFLGGYAFPIAGLILFVMLIWGGIEMMAGWFCGAGLFTATED